MSKRGSGLLLALTVVVALGTIIQDYNFNSSIAQEQRTAIERDRALNELELSLAELRVAQAGYVAAGQRPDTWTTRATETIGALQSAIAVQRGSSANLEARTQYEAAGTLLEELVRVDERARQNVELEQRLFASDLVFVEAADLGDRVATVLRSARDLEAQASAASVTRLANLRLGMNALALGFVLVVMVYFARSGSADAVSEPASTTLIAPPAAPREPAAEREREVAPPPPANPALRAEPAVSLGGAADLCVDLARLMDGRDLPALLERAARVLYAKGVVLWVAEADGTMLRPAVAHGYPEKVLARLGGLQVDAENVTSVAFRTLRPQRLKSAERGGTGAIAVPLISSAGAVGVLSAEMKTATPDDQMVAVARIVAAQLSALIAPAESAIKAAGR